VTGGYPNLIPSTLKVLSKNPDLIREAGSGHNPLKAMLEMSFLMQKNPNRLYKQSSNGYTINRKNHQQQKNHKIDSILLHIELLSKEFLNPIDTEFFHSFFN